jgi:hypothetical protein
MIVTPLPEEHLTPDGSPALGGSHSFKGKAGMVPTSEWHPAMAATPGQAAAGAGRSALPGSHPEVRSPAGSVRWIAQPVPALQAGSTDQVLSSTVQIRSEEGSWFQGGLGEHAMAQQATDVEHGGVPHATQLDVGGGAHYILAPDSLMQRSSSMGLPVCEGSVARSRQGGGISDKQSGQPPLLTGQQRQVPQGPTSLLLGLQPALAADGEAGRVSLPRATRRAVASQLENWWGVFYTSHGTPAGGAGGDSQLSHAPLPCETQQGTLAPLLCQHTGLTHLCTSCAQQLYLRVHQCLVALEALEGCSACFLPASTPAHPWPVQPVTSLSSGAPACTHHEAVVQCVQLNEPLRLAEVVAQLYTSRLDDSRLLSTMPLVHAHDTAGSSHMAARASTAHASLPSSQQQAQQPAAVVHQNQWCLLGPASFLSFGIWCSFSLIHLCQVGGWPGQGRWPVEANVQAAACTLSVVQCCLSPDCALI